MCYFRRLSGGRNESRTKVSVETIKRNTKQAKSASLETLPHMLTQKKHTKVELEYTRKNVNSLLNSGCVS